MIIAKIEIHMPSQLVELTYAYEETREGKLRITIEYDHPTTGDHRSILRSPDRRSFSPKHFDKELDAYIVQEAMSDLTDNRHRYDWIE